MFQRSSNTLDTIVSNRESLYRKDSLQKNHSSSIKILNEKRACGKCGSSFDEMYFKYIVSSTLY